jgi:hypothetical protein
LYRIPILAAMVAWIIVAERSAASDLAGEARVGRIDFIVLAEVAVQLVGEVEETVVHPERIRVTANAV